jgi:hypothetical protein
MMKNRPMTQTEVYTLVEGLIIENFGSMEAFVEAFPNTFEIVYQNGQELPSNA